MASFKMRVLWLSNLAIPDMLLPTPLSTIRVIELKEL
jgi:hypothetical protein